MSRVGKAPIKIPDEVDITYKNRVITVSSQKGSLERSINPTVELNIEDGVISVYVVNDDRRSRAIQ